MHSKIINYRGARIMGLLLVVAEVIFLVRGGWRSAVDDWDRGAFVILAVVLSIGIAFLLSQAYTLFNDKKYFVGSLAVMAWMLVAAYAWGTTVSVSAINRAEIESDRQATLTKATYSADTVNDLTRRLKLKEEALNFLPESRTPEAIQGEINAQKQAKRWDATSGCTNATTARSRAYCQGIARLEAEKADSGKRLELQAEVDNLAKQLQDARSVVTTGPAALASVDPEFKVLASMMTASENPGGHAIWAAEMLRHANLAFVLLLSAIVNLVATALAVKAEGPLLGLTGGQVVSTAGLRFTEPEQVSASPYMATKASEEPTLADKLSNVAVNVAEELRRRFAFRPTGPSAPMIEAAA
jgi:hypothetical protein